MYIYIYIHFGAKVMRCPTQNNLHYKFYK